MGITTTCLDVVSANMTGSALPTHIAIGAGGSVYLSGNTSLVDEWDRNSIDSNDISTNEEVTFTANWNPTELSGLIMKEYAVMTTGSSMLNREVFTGSLVFTGEEELQVQQTFKFFI